MFNIGNGRVVDLWSNGDFTFTGNGPIDYGVAIATADQALDYVGGGVPVTPEPGAFAPLGLGLAAVAYALRRRSARNA